MKRIKLTDEQIRKLLIEGKVQVNDIEIEATFEFSYSKEIYELLQTRIQIDKNIEMFNSRKGAKL